MADAIWLPVAFMCIMAFAMLIYVILDGYDLGVGMLTMRANQQEKDIMMSSIGPFWDANETWLVLGVGILLVAFPRAHSIVLGALYLPVTIMLFGLILRGVAFEFRFKAPIDQRPKWDKLFFIGSLVASLAQGYMLGSYIMGFKNDLFTQLFSLGTAISLASGYCLLGACWLILKTHGALQQRAARWAFISLFFLAAGIAAVSLTTPILDPTIYAKWFAFPQLILMIPIPLITTGLLIGIAWYTRILQYRVVVANWLPLLFAMGVFMLCFNGLAYSYYPYIVPGQLTVWDAASSPAALWIIFIGACVVVPVILAYTVMSYVIFWGKAEMHD